MSSSGPSEDAKQTVREEARYVIDEQLQTLRDIDQKAMATARIIGLVLGLLASAASLADQPRTVLNWWTFSGGIALLLSLCASVVTYSVDRPSYGLGPGYFDSKFGSFDSDEGVSDDLFDRYADWIDDNSEEISTNGTYLLIAQGLFLFGLILIASGIYSIL